MRISIFIQFKHKKYVFDFVKRFGLKSKKYFKSTKLYLTKKEYANFLSILTSPHVNKRAQEQFEKKALHFQLNVRTFEYSKLIIFLKRICSNIFPNLKFKIKLTNKGNRRYFIDDTNILNKKTQNQNFQQKALVKLIDNIGI